MSQPMPGLAGATTQERLSRLQQSMVSLLEMDLPANNDKKEMRRTGEFFVHPADLAEGVGRLAVWHSANRLQVRIKETQDHAGRGEHLGGDEPPLEFRADFYTGNTRNVVAPDLYEFGSMSVSLRDIGARATGLYRPYLWADGGTSLEFDMFGSLSLQGISRVEHIVTYMVGSALGQIQSERESIKVPA